MAEFAHSKNYEASTSDPIVLLEWVVPVSLCVWWDRQEVQQRRKEERHEAKSGGEVVDVELVQHEPESQTHRDFRKIRVPPQGQAKQPDRSRALKPERSKVCGVAEDDGILLPQGLSGTPRVEGREGRCDSDQAFHLNESPLGWPETGR